jgi:hypothetical protein
VRPTKNSGIEEAQRLKLRDDVFFPDEFCFVLVTLNKHAEGVIQLRLFHCCQFYGTHIEVSGINVARLREQRFVTNYFCHVYYQSSSFWFK